MCGLLLLGYVLLFLYFLFAIPLMMLGIPAEVACILSIILAIVSLCVPRKK